MLLDCSEVKLKVTQKLKVQVTQNCTQVQLLGKCPKLLSTGVHASVQHQSLNQTCVIIKGLSKCGLPHQQESFAQ